MFLMGDLVALDLLLRLFCAALLWVLLQLLIRFHQRGIEITGAILFVLGVAWWVSDPGRIPPFGPLLLLLGVGVHAIGRFLFWIRR